MKTIDESLVRGEILKLIRSKEGKGIAGSAFSATFVKRTNGEVRTINGIPSCFTKLGKTGEGLKFSPDAYDLSGVLELSKVQSYRRKGYSQEDAVKKSFRFIPLDAVTRLSINGRVITPEGVKPRKEVRVSG